MSRRSGERRDGYGDGAGVGRDSSRLARRAPLRRGPLEVLESRTLLSTVPDFAIPAFPSLSMGGPPLFEFEGSGSGDGAGGRAPSVGEVPELRVASLLMRTSSTTMGLSMLTTGVGGVGTSISMEGMIEILSTSSGSLAEDSITPVIVLMPGSGGFPVLDAGMGGGSPIHVGVGASASGVGMGGGRPSSGSIASSAPAPWTSTGSTAPGPATASGNVPDARRVEVYGSIDPTTSSVVVKIPVGPTTRQLGLSLHGDPGGDSSTSPVVGDVSLVDSKGQQVEHFGPLWDGQEQGPPGALTLALKDVPEGMLMVRITTPIGTSGSLASLPTGLSLPFMMDVQRIDATATAASPGTGLVVAAADLGSSVVIGTMAGLGGQQVQGWGRVGSSSAPAEVPGPFGTSAVDPSGADEPSESADPTAMDAGARIAVGPLAARAAAPMGPSLSDVPVDPAPPVDRYERALSQEIAARGRDGSRELDAPVLLQVGPGSFPGGGLDRGNHDASYPMIDAIPVIAGLDRSAPGGRARGEGVEAPAGDLLALHAALCDAPGRRDGTDVVDSADLVGGPLLAALIPADSDRRPTPDYLTTACILAFGMGLVGGPILPDLLRLIPRRPPRWLGRRQFPGPEAGHSLIEARGFGGWLRRRLPI